MRDATPAEPTTGPRALDQVDASPRPTLTMTGYCAECGTWDAHGPSCSSCGYDFAGTPTPSPRA